MELRLVRSQYGLSLEAADDDTIDAIRRIPRDTHIIATISDSRNPQFHRKYMKFFNIVWEYQNEDTQSWFGCVRNFRKTIEVAAGHCDKVYNLELAAWVDIPRSVAYDKMEQQEFEDLYERVKAIVFEQFLPVREEEFYEALKYF